MRAYRASPRRLQQDAAEWREQLGLNREGLEGRAYRHLERSHWLLGHLSKALAMHQADEVWVAVARHLFGDREGKHSGMPRLGSYWDYLRIAGRARSHTTERKWETFRLFGTMEGHLAAYRHPELPAEITSPLQAAGSAPGSHVLAQPRHPRLPSRPASWWDYKDPLVLVYNDGPSSREGELILPVRLPQGAGRWPYLLQYLGRPERWHKVDLPPHEIHGFRGDPGGAAAGCLGPRRLGLRGSPDDPGRRLQLTRDQGPSHCRGGEDRVGGVDGNVSNLSVVSFPRSFSPADGDVTSTRGTLSEAEMARLVEKRRKDRARQRALQRSRRANNPGQYQLGCRQTEARRAPGAAGLDKRGVVVPGGGRLVDAGGRPRQPYRHDVPSKGYRRTRGRHAEAAASFQESRTHRARRTAAAIVAVHGPHLTIEEGNVNVWFRRWGRSCLAFSPGRLIRALREECKASGGSLLRVGTSQTALSQRCLCGARVAKGLGQRTHVCPSCGLSGDRDLVSAALAAFTTLDDPTDPATARVDADLARRAQCAFGQRLKAAVAESSGSPRNRRFRGVAPPCSAPWAPRQQATDPRPKGACLCSAECRSPPRGDPGWEHRPTTGKPRAQPGLP